MTSTTWKISPAIFALTVICFLLPFISVSCGGQKVATMTGLNLATGTTLRQQGLLGQQQEQKVNAEFTATLALVATLFGLVLSFVSGKVPATARAVISGGAALMMLLLKSSLDDQVTKRGGGMVKVDYEFGYWFALLLMIGGAALNAYLASQKEEALAFAEANIDSPVPATASPPPPSPAIFPAPPDSVATPKSAGPHFCSQCGQPIERGSKFCAECGAAVS